MFSIAQLIERAKSNSKIESDYRLAKIIGINQSALGNYKAGRSWPNDKILSQLAALSGDDVPLIAAQVQAERSQSPEGKTMWLAVVQRLSGAASTAVLSVLLAIVFVAGFAPPSWAQNDVDIHQNNVNRLYIVLSSAILSVHAFLMVRLRLCAYSNMRRLAWFVWSFSPA